MQKLIVSAAFIALLTGGAFADTDVGTIKKIDPKSDAITLQDGKTFTLAEGTEAETLKVGEKITVTYNMKSGKMVATKVGAAN
jgi:Cu/Ag efflux protein CusF